jgi:hypothetical protein
MYPKQNTSPTKYKSPPHKTKRLKTVRQFKNITLPTFDVKMATFFTPVDE